MQDHTPSNEPSPSLLGLGPAWTRVGYGILVLSVLAGILVFVVHPFLPAVERASAPAGYKAIQGKGGGFFLKASLDGVASVFLLVFSALAAMVWTFVDVVDRKKRFIWLVPMVVCPFILALHALPLALYLIWARETRGASEDVG